MKIKIVFYFFLIHLFVLFNLFSKTVINDTNSGAMAEKTIPIRVFYKGKGVNDLDINDLSLFIDKKRVKILKLEKISKKIVSNNELSNNLNRKNRSFVFIFHIADYKHNMESAIETLFTIINPGDRIMFISNNNFIDNIIVKNKKKLKKKFKNIIKREENVFRSELTVLKNRIIVALKSCARNPHFPYIKDTTSTSFERYRNLFLLLDNKKLKRIYDFLNTQNKNKWVFSFIQSESYYFPSTGFLSALLKKTPLLETNLIPFFFNTKATFNSILLSKAKMHRLTNPEKTTFNFTEESDTTITKGIKRIIGYDYVYKYNEQINPLSLKDAFIDLSKKSGGIVCFSDDFDHFLKKTKNNEDVFYNLTFKYDRNNPSYKNKKTIQIQSKKQFHIVYSEEIDQKLKKKDAIIIKNSFISIRNLSFIKKKIFLEIENIKINNKSEGKIGIRIQLKDKKSKTVLDKKKSFLINNRTFNISIPVKHLHGFYTVFIEVFDFLSMKKTSSNKAIKL